jgi:hypothetical protein
MTISARIARSAAVTLALVSPSLAQTYFPTPVVPLVGCSANGACAGPVSATNPMPVSGSFSAVGGFTPTPSYATLSVGTSSSRVALPTGAVVVVYNAGSNAAYVQLGNSLVTATTSNDVIQPNSWMAFTVGANTYLAAIGTAGSTTLNVSGGSGMPTGAGSGGGSFPTGAVGSPNASVVTVQGIGGGAGIPVTGTFWQATQPTSLASLPALAPGSATIGSIGNISGTISLPTGAATSANQSTVIADLGTLHSDNTTLQGLVTAAPRLGSASGGLSERILTGITSTAVAVFSGAHQLMKVDCDNNNPAFSYLQAFDATSGVTVGSTVPNDFKPIAPSSNSGWALSMVGAQYLKGLMVAATTTPTGGTAPTTNKLNCSFFYN